MMLNTKEDLKKNFFIQIHFTLWMNILSIRIIKILVEVSQYILD